MVPPGPHVIHLVKMKTLRNDMKHLKSNLIMEIKTEMDARGFYSTEHSTGKYRTYYGIEGKQMEAIINR